MHFAIHTARSNISRIIIISLQYMFTKTYGIAYVTGMVLQTNKCNMRSG